MHQMLQMQIPKISTPTQSFFFLLFFSKKSKQEGSRGRLLKEGSIGEKILKIKKEKKS